MYIPTLAIRTYVQIKQLAILNMYVLHMMHSKFNFLHYYSAKLTCKPQNSRTDSHWVVLEQQTNSTNLHCLLCYTDSTCHTNL